MTIKEPDAAKKFVAVGHAMSLSESFKGNQ